MKKVICTVLAMACILGNLCTAANAAELPLDTESVLGEAVPLASNSFNIGIEAKHYRKADVVFSMAAGETVRIRANYSPESASVDFGLVDEEGVFHYIDTKTGSIDETIQVPENGNYTFAIRNNSTSTVRVTGIVTY